MKNIYYIPVSILIINLGYSQIDLALEWEFQEDLFYFDSGALKSVMNVLSSDIKLIHHDI